MSKNNTNMKLWLVKADKFKFTIAAKNKKECKELIVELSEGEITDEITYNEIGTLCPSLPFYDDWVGNPFIISTNFYDI